MADRKVQTDLVGLMNELIEWRLERLDTDPAHYVARFFYNNVDQRVRVGTNTAYKTVAWLEDIYWVNNWKKAARVGTAAAADLSWYTYVVGNEPAWNVWTGVSSAPTIDGVLMVDQDRILIKDDTALLGNGIFYYDAAASAFIRTDDWDNVPGTGEVASSMVPISEGSANKGTIWREIHTDPIALGTDPVEYTPFILNVPTVDELVKVTTAGTEWYLTDVIANTNLTPLTGAGANNLDNIVISVENPGAAELLRFALDLSTYVGDIEIQWDLHVTGETILNDLSFDSGSTVNWDNTTQTGTTTYDSSYNATYDGSTIVYNDTDIDYTGTTEIDYASTVVTNHNGDTINNTNTTENNVGVTNNYDSTSVVNNDGTVNYGDTNVINNNNNTINNNSTFTALGCSGANATPDTVAEIATATKAEVTIVYDDTSTTPGDTWTKVITVTPSSGIITVNDVANGHTGELTIDRSGGSITTTQTSWTGTSTADVCQFAGGVIINDDGSITNNDNTVTNNNGTTTNNSNTDEYYDDNSSVTNMWDTYNENLTVNNLEVTNLDVENITIEWSNIAITGGWNFESNAAVTTSITLVEDPADWDGVFIFTDSGTLLFKDIDWTHTGTTVNFIVDQWSVTIYAKYMPATSVSIQSGVGFKEICTTAPAGGPGLLTLIADAEVTVNTKVLVFLDDSVTPVGFISAKAVAWGVEIYSTQNEPMGLPLCLMVFSATPVTMGVATTKWQDTWSWWANTYVVSDPLITADSCIDVYPKSVPTGNLTVVASAGQFTITTTAGNEDTMVFNYVIVY